MDLEIVGRHALLFDDDSTSTFVNSVEALVPWSENPSLLIDRYDVRHLLQRIPPYSRRQQQGRRVEDDGDGVAGSELDLQRYLDLPHEEEEREEGSSSAAASASASETKKEAEMAGSGAYQAVPFSYGNNDDFSDQKNLDIDLEHSGYRPPFSLPQGLLSHLPPTEKLHQIIARTAIFVSKHGGQSEFILRVKQGDNPTFGFLMPDHQLHAYFRYLVNHPELVDSINNANDGKEEKQKVEGGEGKSHVAAGWALSLLGSVYGSGDDEGDMVQGTNTKEMDFGSSANDVTATPVSKDENRASSTHTSMEGTTNLKPLAVAKEKSVPLRKNRPIVSMHSNNGSSKTKVIISSGDISSGKQQSNLLVSEKILEPSSSLKRMIDRIVEFIVKNGKEFEAVLIEQDRSHGRFPFLLPSSVYHSYYLKILREAHESKILGKNIRDLDSDSSEKAESSRKGQKTKGSTAYLEDTSSQDGMYDPEKKDKFKMVIGGSKKDANELPPKAAKQSGVSADDAAAIVMAATRGSSSSTKLDVPAMQSGMSADVAAAIVLQATRGSSSPPKSVALGNGARSSNGGNLSVLPPNQFSMSKNHSDAKLDTSVPAEISGSSAQLDGEGCDETSNVFLANIIAKTAALAAASEGDSSEASLTREQKLKAERLKRAKMFAAMIKSSGDDKPKLFPPAGMGLSKPQRTASGSMLSGPVSDSTIREREGSSVPEAAMAANMADKHDEKEPAHDRGEHRSRKHRSIRDYDEDREGDQKTLKKKHHSEHSLHHHRKRHHLSAKSKHFDSDEEDGRQKKRSKSRHRHHKHHSSSDDEHHHHRNSHRHRRKSHTSKKQESDYDEGSLPKQESEGEGGATIYGHSGEASTKPQDATANPSTSDAQPSDAAGVSDELRAKVRAMLLATM